MANDQRSWSDANEYTANKTKGFGDDGKVAHTEESHAATATAHTAPAQTSKKRPASMVGLVPNEAIAGPSCLPVFLPFVSPFCPPPFVVSSLPLCPHFLDVSVICGPHLSCWDICRRTGLYEGRKEVLYEGRVEGRLYKRRKEGLYEGKTI
jgi:hypothetical protein